VNSGSVTPTTLQISQTPLDALLQGCVSTSVRVGFRVELTRRLFGNAGRREADVIVKRKLTRPRYRRYCRLGRPLRQVPRVSCAYDFGDSFSKHRERGDEQPEPPEATRRCEKEGTKRNQYETNSHECFGYSICDGGGPFIFVVAVAVSTSG